MAGKIKGVRFSDETLKNISKFLKKNPIYDFSKLVRNAVDGFIKGQSEKEKKAKK